MVESKKGSGCWGDGSKLVIATRAGAVEQQEPRSLQVIQHRDPLEQLLVCTQRLVELVLYESR